MRVTLQLELGATVSCRP